MINLEFNRNVQPKVWAKQGDSGRILEFICTKDFKAIDLTGKSVKFNMKKPNVVYINCSVVNAPQGIINVPLTNSVLAECGQYFADISITDTAAKVVSSATIVLEISETQADTGALESSDEYNALAQTMADYIDMKEQFNDALNAVNEGETVRVNLVQAVTNANTATTALEAATTVGNTAKIELENATSTANTSKTALETATETANTAKTELETVITDTEMCKDYSGVEHDNLKERLDADMTGVYDRFNKSNYIPYRGMGISAQDTYLGRTKNISILGNTLKNYKPNTNIVCGYYIAGEGNNVPTKVECASTAYSASMTIKENVTMSALYFTCGTILSYNLQPNTVYTMFMDTSRNMDFDVSFVDSNGQNMSLKVGAFNTAKRAISFKTPAAYASNANIVYIKVYGNANVGDIIKIDNLMILDGDWTGKSIPKFFSGVKSVGETEQDSNDKYPIFVQSNANTNLLIDSTLTQTPAKPNWGKTISCMAVYDGYSANGCHFTTSAENVDGSLAGNGAMIVIDFKKIGVNYGETCTFSVDIKGTSTNAAINILSSSPEGDEYWRRIVAAKSITIQNTVYNRYAITFDIPGKDELYSRAHRVYVRIGAGFDADVYFKNIKLTKGADTIYTMSPYDMDTTDTVNIDAHKILLDEPLRGIENKHIKFYDEITGNQIIRRIGKITIDGGDTYTIAIPSALNSSDNDYLCAVINVGDKIKPGSLAYVRGICDAFKTVSRLSTEYADGTCECVMFSDNGQTGDNYASYIGVRILKSKLTANTVDALKTYLAAHPFTCYYVLNVPTTTTIDFTDFKTFDGHTDIVSGNTVNSLIACSIPTNVQARISALLVENATLLDTNTKLKTKAERLQTENTEQQTQINDLSDITDYLIASSL